MGKRRTEFEHKDPRAMNDDDDEEDEDDLIIEEAPSKEQLESIKQRKKLVPKRKLASGDAASTITSSITNNSPFASLKPFPISSTTTTSSLSNANEDAEKPSIFAGFKGFSGFKPLPVQTSSTTAATQQPLSTITNSETMSLSSSSSTLKPFSFTATSTTTTTTTATTPSVSLFSNGFNSTTATTANNGPTTTLTATTTTPISTDINKNGSKSSGEEEKKSETSSSKNINDMEMRFIVGLNELYQRCYGDSLPKRQYKLPADALSGGDSAYTNGSSSIDQAEAKYASLLAELNRNCSKWISKHVEESPFVILTPVFVDYFNYLILLEKSFFPDTFKQQPTTTSTTTTTASSLPSTTTTKSSSSTVLNGESNSNTTPFSFSNYLNGHKENSSEQTFKAPNEKKSIIDFSATTTANKEPSSEFKFTGMPALTTTATTPSTTSFKFGLANATASASETTASPAKMLSVTPLNTVKPQLNLPSDITPKSILTENEPKKDTTTTPLFKFGSDSNKTDLSTSSTLLGSKPSETASTIFKPFTMSTQSPFSSLVSSSSSSSNTTQNQPAATTTTTTTPSSIFSFGSGNNQPASTTTASPFANLQAGGLAAKSATLFPSSGGIFSGFSTEGTSILGGGGILGGAGATTQSADAEGGDDEKEEYQPPKPESSDVKEEGSVFTKRCKLYYFSDKEKKFTDRGIGNLFLKPTPPKEGAEPSYQLIVRADNKLAQILLNVKLSKVFPVSRDGPKDISYLCLPNPPIQNVDSNVPCKFLFKVKTEQDAAELLEKLNEYKK